MENRIKNIAFDLGGVVISLSYENAVRRFEEIGLKEARTHLDAYHQKGIFGDLEAGLITIEDFCQELSRLAGRELTMNECYYAWHGYVKDVPKRNLETLKLLRSMNYQVCLLSNTNPFMMQWARSGSFDGDGHSIEAYFDALYLSYECKAMKPSKEIFEIMLSGQHARPEETLFIDDSLKNVEAAAVMGMETLCPQDNEDWTEMLLSKLSLQQ